MTTPWQSLRARLERFTAPFPQDAIELADAHRDELVPELVALLDALARDTAPAQDDDYVLHLYAMLLLARWREPAAYRPLARLGHLGADEIDLLFGEMVHDSYGRSLASCCDGDPQPLRALAEDVSAAMWVRAAALEAMSVAALEGRLPRDAVIAFFIDLGEREAAAQRAGERDPGEFLLLDALATRAADMGAAELAPLIRAWFRADLLDPSYADPAELDAQIARSPEACRDALRARGEGLIGELAHETADWPGFSSAARLIRPIPLGLHREPIRRDAGKVGRNDPCPCGSGRKYKKCHGADH